MPERWQRELRKLKSVQPPGDLWDRVMLGPRLATQAKLGRRWPGWVAPLAAAAAVVAVVAGTAAVSNAIHGPRATAGAGRAHPVTAYVANDESGTVTPIATATNTAGHRSRSGAALTPSRSPRTARPPTSPTAIGHGDPDRDRHRHRGHADHGGRNPSASRSPRTARPPTSPTPSSGTVTPIATATNTAGPPITVGSRPDAIAITPDGKTAYVANNGSGTVTPIATATNTARTPIKVGPSPGASRSPRTARPPTWSTGSNTVTPIATATNTAGTDQPAALPTAIAITPDGTTAYVTNDASGTVTPIATASNTAATDHGRPESLRDRHHPGRHDRLRGQQGLEQRDPHRHCHQHRRPTDHGRQLPRAIAITPDGTTAYVTNGASSSVTPIATASNTALPPIKTGCYPDAVAIAP